VCRNCDCGENRCSNKVVQRQTYPTILVKETKYGQGKEIKYGQGAFATTGLKKSTIVGEYVGEIFANSSQRAHEAHEFIHPHVEMNYAFGLEPDHVIDSATAGNETRYLNHSEHPNCSASVLNVNHTRKIVLVADKDVEGGQELYLDYGEKYWNLQRTDRRKDKRKSIDVGR